MAVTLITGTSSGIGEASALAFARAGHRTHASMRNLAKAGRLRELAKREDLPLSVVALDVTDGASIDACVRQVEAAEGRIDVLVNNAGLGGATPMEDLPEEEHRLTFEVNYFGACRAIQRVLPGMRERRQGRIVNVSSGAGRVATANQVAYTGSKWALEGMTEALAIEVRRFGIRCSLIEPGLVETAIFENSAPYTRFDKRSPYVDLMRRAGRLYSANMKHAGRPEDVASIILEAATVEEPKLRYVVGDDALRLVGGRAILSDEDFVALGEDISDEEYIERFRRYFAIDLG